MTRLTRLALGVGLLLALAGSNTAGAFPRERAASEAAAFAAASATPAATKVKKLVFVGKENACDCTRKRIEAGWAALQKALGAPPRLPVVRLQIDTQADKVEPYRAQKAMAVLPAIYLVDGKDAVLGLLQGGVTAEQISAAINTGNTP